MGMIGQYRHISANALSALLRDPSLARPLTGRQPLQSRPADFARELRDKLVGLPPDRIAVDLARMQPLLRQAQASLTAHAVEHGASPARAAADPLRDAGLGAEDVAKIMSIDKAWDGLRVVVAGKERVPTNAVGTAVFGGTPIGGDVGYGPLQYLTTSQVTECAAALTAIDDEQFRARCSLDVLGVADVYVIDVSDPDSIDWLVETFANLRAYFVEASGQGRAMLAWIG